MVTRAKTKSPTNLLADLDRRMSLDVRVRKFDRSNELFKTNPSSSVEAWGTGDVLTDSDRLLGRIFAQSVEITSCSPVISRTDLQRIRNNVVNQLTTFRNGYSNVGSSLDARGLVAQYGAVFNAMEGGQYCYSSSDQDLINDISNCSNSASQILNNAFNQYATTFNANLIPIRTSYGALQQAVTAATNSVDALINAYTQLWDHNFTFNLYSGLNASVDNLTAEYDRLMNGSNTLFDQGTSRVQVNFEAEVRQSNVVFADFAKAYNHWNNTDGAVGYGMYIDNMRAYQECLGRINKFEVLDTPINSQIFTELKLHVAEIKRQYAEFPTFIQAMPSNGLLLDPGTSALKFFSRQAVLNLAQASGAHFATTIAPGQSLIGTGFSYKHGGKMPPHAEHKTGKDCDLFSAYFKVGAATYNEQKAIQMVSFLLNSGVSRVIYTNDAVVRAANSACPGNAVAKNLAGHETHIHFDLDSAT